MKNVLLALALFATIGTATAHDGGKAPKKAKKQTCTMHGTAACCAKKDAKTAAVKVPAKEKETKSL